MSEIAQIDVIFAWLKIPRRSRCNPPIFFAQSAVLVDLGVFLAPERPEQGSEGLGDLRYVLYPHLSGSTPFLAPNAGQNHTIVTMDMWVRPGPIPESHATKWPRSFLGAPVQMYPGTPE